MDFQPKTKILEVNEPEERKGGAKVSDVDELVQKLQFEAKIL